MPAGAAVRRVRWGGVAVVCDLEWLRLCRQRQCWLRLTVHLTYDAFLQSRCPDLQTITDTSGVHPRKDRGSDRHGAAADNQGPNDPAAAMPPPPHAPRSRQGAPPRSKQYAGPGPARKLLQLHLDNVIGEHLGSASQDSGQQQLTAGDGMRPIGKVPGERSHRRDPKAQHGNAPLQEPDPRHQLSGPGKHDSKLGGGDRQSGVKYRSVLQDLGREGRHQAPPKTTHKIPQRNRLTADDEQGSPFECSSRIIDTGKPGANVDIDYDAVCIASAHILEVHVNNC